MARDLYDELVSDERYLQSFANVTILGVAGTNGSGKDSLMKLLEGCGFLVYNTSDRMREVVKVSLGSTRRGGNDSPMGIIGNAQRRRYPGGAVELGLIDWWARVAHLPEQIKPRGLVIGSIRSTGEAERIKAVGGKLVVVDADREVRYRRIASRLREDEHGLTYEQFCQQEDAELAAGQTDPTKFAMAAVLQAADITIANNTTIEEFAAKAEDVLHDAGINIS
jgi:dephospho-CoA kinase